MVYSDSLNKLPITKYIHKNCGENRPTKNTCPTHGLRALQLLRDRRAVVEGRNNKHVQMMRARNSRIEGETPRFFRIIPARIFFVFKISVVLAHG